MDIGKFDYLAYCDASGDDGMKFHKGSSWVFSVATLLMKREDLGYNEDVFAEAKGIAGVCRSREVKYTSVRKMRRGPKMMARLSDLRARLFVGITLKTKLDPSDDLSNPKLKMLSALSQAFPTIQCSEAIESTDILGIAIDQQKKVEQNLVSGLLQSVFSKKGLAQVPYVEFLDSKSSLMIQCADWCAGAFGEAFERFVRGQSGFPFGSCGRCSPQTPLCRWGRKRQLCPTLIPLIPLKDLMLVGREDIKWGDLSIIPTDQMPNTWFLRCQLFRRGPLYGPIKGQRYDPHI